MNCTDIIWYFKISIISASFINLIKMLDLSNDTESNNIVSKSEKVELNLRKIRSLIRGALRQLKQTQRVSTNESDSSQNQSPEFIHRMSLDLHKGKTEIMLQSLEKGYVMKKHSPNTKPKQKYVYISNDRRFICWKSLVKDDQKRIQLRKICLVLQGEEETILHVQSNSVKTLERMIVIKSDGRDLELEAFDTEQSIKFQMEIKEAIKNAKGIHLSYKL